jgi:hypothetical protein
MRQHLAELRHAAGGLGRDMALEFEHVDEKINRLGKLTARDARHAAEDIRDDFTDMARALDQEAHRLPHQVGSAASRAGAAIGDATSRFASATGAAFESAGSKAREGTRNALAHAAGVRRTPMKEWHKPSNESDSSSR